LNRSDPASLIFQRINLFGKKETMVHLLAQMKLREGCTLVTPNIHHLTLLRQNNSLFFAYKNAKFVLPDGWPVAMLASLKRGRLVVRQTGSDLVSNLIGLDEKRIVKIAILGGSGSNAFLAAQNIGKIFPQVDVVYVNSCPPAEIEKPYFIEEIREQLNIGSPDLVLVGLGCPKQEIFSDKHLRGLLVGIICNVGATIDFYSGEKTRAPKVLRAFGFEWLYRLHLEPKRLFGRYAAGLRDFPFYVVEFSKEIFLRCRGKK